MTVDMRLRHLLLATVATAFISCTTKDDYIGDFISFIDEVSHGHEAFDEARWVEADERFRELSEDAFDEYKESLTDDELHVVDSCEAIYLGLKATLEAKEKLGR